MLFLAGAISGIVETIVVQPFDMIKTRFQLNEGKNTNVFRAFFSIIKEGGMLRFYRGILPELVGNLPAASVMLSSYELFKRGITTLNGGVCSLGVVYGAGLLTGFPETLVCTPFQVVKIRMQSKDYLGYYKNSIDCAFKILRHEGIAALMIGVCPSFWRNCAWNSIYFALLFYLKSLLPAPRNYSIEATQTFFTGAIAGAAATIFAAPFDMVKSRFQCELRSNDLCHPRVPVRQTFVLPSSRAPLYFFPQPSLYGSSFLKTQVTTVHSSHDFYSQFTQQHSQEQNHTTTIKSKYKGTLNTLYTVYKTEGPRAVYKGLCPKLLRMTIGGGVCMTSFDIACIMLPRL